MKKQSNINREVLSALSLLTQLGLTMVICIFIGVFTGRWIDRKIGTSPLFLIVFSLLGGGASIKMLYDTVKKRWIDNEKE